MHVAPGAIGNIAKDEDWRWYCSCSASSATLFMKLKTEKPKQLIMEKSAAVFCDLPVRKFFQLLYDSRLSVLGNTSFT